MTSKHVTTPTASDYRWLALVLLCLTAYGSLIPLRFRPMPLAEGWQQFRDLVYYDPSLLYARGDWVVNAVQYAAAAFCIMGALAADRSTPYGLLAAFAVVPFGVLGAFLLEVLQVWFPPRTVSLNDLAVESAGILAGTISWLLAGQPLTDWLRRFWGRKSLSGLASQFLPMYGAALLAAHLMPFDLVVGRRELLRKYAEGKVLLIPLAGLSSLGLGELAHQAANMLAFLVVGLLSGLTLNGSRRGWRFALALGLGVTTTIEVLQLFVYTRFCNLTDVLTGTASVLLGWRLAGLVRGLTPGDRYGGGKARPDRAGGVGLTGARGSTAAWLGLAAWLTVVVVTNWQPFHFTGDAAEFHESDPWLSDENTLTFGLRRVAWAPLVDYYWGSRYDALDQFLRRSLSFAPLGAIVALMAGRRERRGVAFTLTAAVAVALVIEVGQYFIPERHPGPTDVLIEVCGAWFGFALARHTAHALEPDSGDRGNLKYHYPAVTADGPAGRPGWEAPRPPEGRRRRFANFLAISRGGRQALTGGSRPDDRLRSTLAWLDAQPFSIRLAVLCTGSTILVLGLVAVLRILRLA